MLVPVLMKKLANCRMNSYLSINLIFRLFRCVCRRQVLERWLLWYMPQCRHVECFRCNVCRQGHRSVDTGQWIRYFRIRTELPDWLLRAVQFRYANGGFMLGTAEEIQENSSCRDE